LNVWRDGCAGIDDGTSKVGINDLYDQIKGCARRGLAMKDPFDGQTELTPDEAKF
jgi:hypothetical protein